MRATTPTQATSKKKSGTKRCSRSAGLFRVGSIESIAHFAAPSTGRDPIAGTNGAVRLAAHLQRGLRPLQGMIRLMGLMAPDD